MEFENFLQRKKSREIEVIEETIVKKSIWLHNCQENNDKFGICVNLLKFHFHGLNV